MNPDRSRSSSPKLGPRVFWPAWCLGIVALIVTIVRGLLSNDPLDILNPFVLLVFIVLGAAYLHTPGKAKQGQQDDRRLEQPSPRDSSKAADGLTGNAQE